jgi:intracellular sulfur oxidation DsrE/DsrF family protein
MALLKKLLLALLLPLLPLCVSAQTPASAPVKVVYHVNTGVETAAAILNNIKNDFLVTDAKDSKGREFSGQVSALAGRGVDFRVCNNTLQTRHIDAGQLLMEAKVVPSGVAEVARLQAREGYVYLKP